VEMSGWDGNVADARIFRCSRSAGEMKFRMLMTSGSKKQIWTGDVGAGHAFLYCAARETVPTTDGKSSDKISFCKPARNANTAKRHDESSKIPIFFLCCPSISFDCSSGLLHSLENVDSDLCSDGHFSSQNPRTSPLMA
jgi:hypothetical protein